MPWERVIADTTAAVRAADTVVDACRDAVSVVARHSDAICAVLLPVHDHLRCVAATGSWQVFSSVAPGTGVVGRVFASGRGEVVDNTTRDGDYIPLGPDTTVEVVVPLLDPTGLPVGVLNMEWTGPADTAGWLSAAGHIGRELGVRIVELRGPPAESRSEKMLRHALTLTTASTEQELLTRSLRAARDVSGLSSQVLLLTMPDSIEVDIDETYPTPLATKIAQLDPADLTTLIARAERYGASYSLGDPGELNDSGFEMLTALGVRTLIAVPVGVRRNPRSIGGVLLSADERVLLPDSELVNLISLLAAQAWTTLERIQTQQHLQNLANSDPLTGLRHYGSFGERLAHARAGSTAVFAIDVDSFKTINDTYGHQAGDRALVELAQSLAGALRSADELYRIGGDEFAAVVDVQRGDEALSVAERLVKAAHRVQQTISVGVAIHHDGETSVDTLRRADAALYVAKRSGRDGVRMAA
ncbi:MAG TPA: GGDEF domain-containing protein [Micromonosporaceae bacterium]|nr:GGDEF domain-containing protein [Micromonosporaceae bacterium]